MPDPAEISDIHGARARQITQMAFGPELSASPALRAARDLVARAAIEAAMAPGQSADRALFKACMQAASMGEGPEFSSLRTSGASLLLPCARWLAQGESFEAFDAARAQAASELARMGELEFSRPLLPLDEASNRALLAQRGRLVRDGALAQALALGPLRGQDPADIAQREYAWRWDAPESSQACQALAREGAATLGFCMLGSGRADALTRAVGAAATALAFPAAAMRDALATRSQDPQTIAARIGARFGFCAVNADGSLSPTRLSSELLSLENALADACQRLGVKDCELGRRGASALSLAPRRMRREGVGGFCSVATGDITLDQGASASLIAHEWAHSLDGRLGQALGGGCATDRAMSADLQGPIAQAARELAEAARGSPLAPAWSQAEERRLGRLGASQIAIKVLGREAWASASEEEREDFLREASPAGLSIACYQAKRIELAREGRLSPKKALRGWEDACRQATEQGAGGALGMASRQCAQALMRVFGADPALALRQSLEMGIQSGLPLGQMVLESGAPLFDADGGARILSRPQGSYDALCAGLDALEFNPRMPKGYWSSPCEILARAVERHTSRGVFENAFRLFSCAATPSSKAQAERFKASWSQCLALAGVEQRPAGMRLTSSAPQALLSCASALFSPVSALARSGAQRAARLARRRLGQTLSARPASSTPSL